jgi:hypothetical protein
MVEDVDQLPLTAGAVYAVRRQHAAKRLVVAVLLGEHTQFGLQRTAALYQIGNRTHALASSGKRMRERMRR